MRLTFNPGAETVTVNIQLGGAVKLDGPELWQFNGEQYVKLPDPQQTQATATWAGVPRVGPDGVVLLQLHWDAIEPDKPKWRYPATITVTDQGGSLLQGRDGHTNPTVLACDIGVEHPHFDHRREFIGIAA